MNAEIIAMVVLAVFQFILFIIVGLVGFIFKSTMANLKEFMSMALEHLSKDVKDLKNAHL